MKKRKPTKTAMAQALGCSRSTLHTWEAAGCPVNDIGAAQRWVAVNGVGSDMSAPPDLKRKIAEQRLAILQQQRIAAERDNQTKSGELVSLAECQRQAAAAMGYTFSELEQIANSVPPGLAGLDAVSIFKRLKSEIERMRKTLQEKFESIGKP